MRHTASLVLVVLLTLVASAASADELPLYARGVLGAGAGTLSADVGGSEPTSQGPGLLWGGALGVFVTRRLALHGSAFGSASPHARPSRGCVDNCGPDVHQTVWAQTIGAGLTATRAEGPSPWRPFFSTSTGLAIVGARQTEGWLGVGVEVMFGLEYVVRPGLRVGLGLQGMFEGLGPRTEDHFRAWHGGGVFTVSYDRRQP